MDSRKKELIQLVHQYARSYTDDNELIDDAELQAEIKQRYDAFPEGSDKKYIKSCISLKAVGYNKFSEERIDVGLNVIRGSYLVPLADAALTGKLTLTRSILCCFFGATCGFTYTYFKRTREISTDPELARQVKPYQNLMKALRLEPFSLPDIPDNTGRQNFSQEENASDGIRRRDPTPRSMSME